MEDDSRWWHHLWGGGWIISLICSRKIERMAVFFSFSTVSNIFVEMKKNSFFLHLGLGRWINLGKFIKTKIKMGCCLL